LVRAKVRIITRDNIRSSFMLRVRVIARVSFRVRTIGLGLQLEIARVGTIDW